MAINPLQFQHNGKTYVIKSITQKQGTSEIKLDPSTLPPAELAACIAQAQRVMDVVSRLANKPQDLGAPHAFTIHMTQNLQSPSLTQLTLGRIFKKRLGWKPQDATLKIIYKETAASEEKTFKLLLDSYTPAARTQILEATNPLNDTIGFVIQSRQTNPPLHDYTPPSSSSSSSSSPSTSSSSSSSGSPSSTTTSTSGTSSSSTSTTSSTSSSSSSSSPAPQLDPTLVVAAQLLSVFNLMNAGSPATPASASGVNPPLVDEVD